MSFCDIIKCRHPCLHLAIHWWLQNVPPPFPSLCLHFQLQLFHKGKTSPHLLPGYSVLKAILNFLNTYIHTHVNFHHIQNDQKSQPKALLFSCQIWAFPKGSGWMCSVQRAAKRTYIEFAQNSGLPLLSTPLGTVQTCPWGGGPPSYIGPSDSSDGNHIMPLFLSKHHQRTLGCPQTQSKHLRTKQKIHQSN